MSVLLATALASVSADALRDYAAVQCGAAQVEVLWVGLPEEREPAAGDVLSFEGDPCHPRPRLTLTVSRDGRRSGEFALRPGLELWVRTTVAPRDVLPGETVEPTWGLVRLEQARGGPVEGPVVSKLARRTGEPLTAALVRAVPAAHAGDRVQVRWASGPLVLTAEARLREDGVLGELVRVVTTSTQQALEGVLVAADTVVLEGT